MAFVAGSQPDVRAAATPGATRYAGKLRMLPDQIFSEITATIAEQFLSLIPCDQAEFLEKLKCEAGVNYEDKENCGTVILKGNLEQIILAKLKMEKYIVELHEEPQEQQGSNPFQHMLNDNAKKVLLPEKIKVGRNWKNLYKTPMSVQSTLAATRSPLKSRRKVGRPRKIPLPETNVTGSSSVAGPSPSVKDDTVTLDTCVSPNTVNAMSVEENVGQPSAVSSDAFRNGYDEVLKKASQWFTENNSPSEMSFESYLEETRGKKSKDNSAYKFSCELCSFTANKEGQLLKHVLIHAKGGTVHKCDKCSFASVSMNHFIRHRLSHSEAVFSCPQCDFQTDEAKQLARHVTLKHTLVKTPPTRSSILQCSECPYNTTKIYHFERHLLVHNHDLKSLLQVYQCDECSYKSHRKEHFLRHKDVHLRRRLTFFECAQCSFSFKTMDSLQQHQAMTHNITSSMPTNGISSDELLSFPGLATYLAETCVSQDVDNSNPSDAGNANPCDDPMDASGGETAMPYIKQETGDANSTTEENLKNDDYEDSINTAYVKEENVKT